MTRHEFLSEIHRLLEPRSYLEIGVNKGESLALSRARTIAVDPAYTITAELRCDLRLVRATSDDFFASSDRFTAFPDGCVDLAFIDGMHLFEFALRDLVNVERHTRWTSVIVFDDVLPRNVREPSRERDGMLAWTGDVFKLTEVLAKHRPDLLVLPVDTDPTGLLLVLGPDPEERALAESYDAIVAEYVYPDPQRVPKAVLRREGAVEPLSILEAPFWKSLREARDRGASREEAWTAVCRSVEAAARPAPLRDVTPAQLRPKETAARQRGRKGNRRGCPPPRPRSAPTAFARLRRRVGRLRRRTRRAFGGGPRRKEVRPPAGGTRGG